MVTSPLDKIIKIRLLFFYKICTISLDSLIIYTNAERKVIDHIAFFFSLFCYEKSQIELLKASEG